MPGKGAKDAWQEPPEQVEPEWINIHTVRGGPLVLARAILLASIDPVRISTLRAELSEAAAGLLDQAPASDAWIPAELGREFLGFAQRHVRGGLAGPVGRLNAERDSGRATWAGEAPQRLLPGLRAEDLMASLQAMYAEYFRGGTARLDHMEPGQAWISLWTLELFPGWAAQDIPEWFRRAFQEGYGCAVRVSYLAPPAERPWWHRYHLKWI
jgi:hypothetical protein